MTRKQYTPEQKLQIIQIIKEALETGNASIVTRRYDISASLVGKWVRRYKRERNDVPGGEKQQKTCNKYPVTIEEHKRMISENEKLKKLLGEKELEIEILRDLLKKTNPNLLIK